MAHKPSHDPVNWFLGGLGALGSVIGALALDPTGVVATFVLTVIDQASILFTVSSIFGFTVAPNVESLTPYAPYLQGAALVLALIFAATLLDQFWDNLKERIL